MDVCGPLIGGAEEVIGGAEDGAERGGGGGPGFEEPPSVTADIVLRDAPQREGYRGCWEETEGATNRSINSAGLPAPQEACGGGGGDIESHNSMALGWGEHDQPISSISDEIPRVTASPSSPRLNSPGRDDASTASSGGALHPVERQAQRPHLHATLKILARASERGSVPESSIDSGKSPCQAISSESSWEASAHRSMESDPSTILAGGGPRRASITKRHDDYLATLCGHRLKRGLQSLLHQKTPNILDSDDESSNEQAMYRPDSTSMHGSSSSANIRNGMPPRGASGSNSTMKNASAVLKFRKLLKDEDAENLEESEDRILLVYVAAFLLCFLALSDIATCLTWHLAQYRTDYMCGVPADSSTKPAPRSSVVVIGVLLIAGNILHLVHMWAGQVQAENNWMGSNRLGHVHGLIGAYYLVASSGFFFWSIAILFATAVSFVVHATSCAGRVTTTCSDIRTTSDVLLDVNGIAHYHLLFHGLRAMTLISHCLKLRTRLRKDLQVAVSMNKRRYIDQKLRFDLDLTYICDRVIAMAVPCVGSAVYRNDMSEVSRFFATNHYGQFLVFNLCEPHEEVGNGNYDNSLLYNQVVKIPFRDHNAPTLHVLVQFVKQASEWLDLSPSHVLAVHCKGGKGRTGTMISCLLLWVFFRLDPKDALDYFAERRTGKVQASQTLQGVAAPSQIRYVKYMARLQKMPALDYMSPPSTVIKKVILRTLPYQTLSALNVQMVIEAGGVSGFMSVVYDHCRKTKEIVRLMKSDKPASDVYEFDVGHLLVSGDVVIRFFYFPDGKHEPEYDGHDSVASGESKISKLPIDKTLAQAYSISVSPDGQSCICMGLRGKILCFAQFNTCFCTNYTIFEKFEVDQVYSKSDRIVSPEFQLEVVQDLLKSSTPKGCAPASSDTSLQPGAEMGGAENGSRLPTRGDSVMSAFSRAHNAQLHTSSNDSGILLALSPGQVQGNARPKITIEIPYPARNEAPESTDRDHPARIASSTDIQSVLWGSGPCDQGPIRFRKDSSNTSLTSESGRSPPRSPVSGLVQRTRASISSILGLNSKPSALALKNNTFSPSPRLEYLNCYGEEPFSLAYQRALTGTCDLLANKLPKDHCRRDVFEKGQVVFRVGQKSARLRFAMITHGSACWQKDGGEAWEKHTIDITSRRGWSVGSGCLVGLFEFFFGPCSRIDEKLELVADRDDVRVTYVEVGRIQGGFGPPLVLPGSSLLESMDFWMVVAKQSIDRMRNQDTAMRLAHRLRFVRCQPFIDGDGGGDVSQTGRMVQYAKSHFEIRSREQLIATALCNRKLVDPTTGMSTSIPGRLFIFTNWMVWHGIDACQGEDRKWDVCIMLEKIKAVKGNRSSAEITIDTGVDRDADCLPSISGSLFSGCDQSQGAESDSSPDVSSSRFPVGRKPSVVILGDDPPNQRQDQMHGQAKEKESSGGSWKSMLDIALQKLALPVKTFTMDILQNSGDQEPEEHGCIQVLKNMILHALLPGNGAKDTFLPENRAQMTTNLGLHNNGIVNVMLSFKTIAVCQETTMKMRTRVHTIKAGMAGSENRKGRNNNRPMKSKSTPKDLGADRFAAGGICGYGFLPENFGYFFPGESHGDDVLISELFKSAHRIKYRTGSMIFSRKSLPNLKMYHLVSGVVHELNEVDEIVDKFYPGAICGVKQLFAAGNVAHTTSLLAGTNVEMLELSVTCSEDQFFQVLRKHPASAIRFYRAVSISCFSQLRPEMQHKTALSRSQDSDSLTTNSPRFVARSKSPLARYLKSGSFRVSQKLKISSKFPTPP